MKILYVTQRLPFGPGESFIVPEIQALLEAGHEVLVVPRLGGEPVRHDDVAEIVQRTRRLPGSAAVAATVAACVVRRPRATAAAFWRLRHRRPRRRVTYNALATAQGLWLARLARQWGADHIHAHWAHLTATMAMAAAEASGIPWSFTAHRYDVVLNNLLDQKLRSARFGRFIARCMLDLARPWLSPEALRRTAVIHMGVDVPERLVPPRPRPIPILLCPARLVPVKGQRYLVEAAGQLARRGIRFELWLAGDGPNRADLVSRIAQTGVTEQVRLLGALPHRELLGLYRRGEVDVVVLPSLDLGGGEHEGISVAAIEPMAWGLPVVSTSTGGMPELLERGAGVLVAPADGAALADALASLVQSPERRAGLGRAARQRILEEFDVRLIAAELARRFADRTGGPVAGPGPPPVAVAAGAPGADPWAKSSRSIMPPAEPEDA